MENENQSVQPDTSGKSFLKGIIVGCCFTAVLAVLAFSIFVLANEKSKQALQQNQQVETAEDVALSEKVFKKLQKIAKIIDEYSIEDLDVDELETYIYKGLLAGTGDEYSAYYSEEELEEFMEQASGNYSGIGVTMQYDSAVRMAKVVSINEKAPAAEVDIQVGDYIYKVDGEDVTMTTGDLTDVATKVRGEEGTQVKLTLLRGNDNEEIEVEVERRNVEVESVSGQMLEDQIGYIQITEFEGNTAAQFKEVYEGLKAEGAQGLVLDLRANPGGQVDSVVEIAEYFVPEGIITYMEDKNGKRQNFYGSGKNIWNKPLTVLVDGNSASASEILAGAIRDYNMGDLLGTTTFGKGIVQQTVNLGDNTAMKITFAKYYTPKGENIHKKGIEPDIKVEYEALEDGETYDIKTDNQVQAAVKHVKEQMAGTASSK